MKEKSNNEHVKEKEREAKNEASDGKLSFNFTHNVLLLLQKKRMTKMINLI